MFFKTLFCFLLLCITFTGCIFGSTNDNVHSGIQVEGDSDGCDDNRPCEITPISKNNLPRIGFNNWVKKNTPDSLLPFIDSSLFCSTVTEYNGHFPLKYPYYLRYYPASDYFTLNTGDCEYSSLAELDSSYTFNEIFQIAINDNHIFMITYDDDLSFMDSKKRGIEYHISDLDFKHIASYSNKSDFMEAVNSITYSLLNTTFDNEHFSNEDFIKWYKAYTF